MRRLLERYEQRVDAFVDQSERAALIVAAGPGEQIALLKIVEGIDAKRPDLVFVFPGDFENVAGYVESLIALHEARLTMLSAQAEAEGLPPFPGIPPEVRDPRVSPIDRARFLFMHQRSMIGELDGRVLVVALLPSRIADPAEWARFLAELVHHQLPLPWCHHMRFVVREDAARAVLHEHRASLPHLDFYRPDLGQAAVEKALEDSANDESLPLEERLQSLLILAGADTSYKRIPEAVEKYQLLARYHRAKGDKPMYALCLNGIGEACMRGGNLDLAKRYFEWALTPAIEAMAAQVMVNASLNLAYLHRTREQYVDAYAYYEAVSDLAKALRNPALKIQALEQGGFCMHKLGRHQRAWELWTEAVTLAAGIEAHDHELGCLERIRALYAELGMRDRQREVEDEMRRLEALGARRPAA